jgi:hypothetical protein
MEIAEKTVEEKLDLVLQTYAGRSKEIGAHCEMNPEVDYPIAWCRSKEEWKAIVDALDSSDFGCLKYQDTNGEKVQVTVKGWKWLADVACRLLGFAYGSGGADSGCAGLGTMYSRGDGVPRDVSRAVSLYRKAHADRLFAEDCDRGNAASCAKLGDMLARGEGVAKDTRQAADRFRKACDGGIRRGCDALRRLRSSDP